MLQYLGVDESRPATRGYNRDQRSRLQRTCCQRGQQVPPLQLFNLKRLNVLRTGTGSGASGCLWLYVGVENGQPCSVL
jgi:hypothetical protein